MISAKQEHKIPFKAMDSNLTYTAKQPSKVCSQTLTYRALRHLKAVLYPVAMSHHNKYRIGNECSWLSLSFSTQILAQQQVETLATEGQRWWNPTKVADLMMTN